MDFKKVILALLILIKLVMPIQIEKPIDLSSHSNSINGTKQTLTNYLIDNGCEKEEVSQLTSELTDEEIKNVICEIENSKKGGEEASMELVGMILLAIAVLLGLGFLSGNSD